MGTKTDKQGREIVEIRYEMAIPGTFSTGPIMGHMLNKLKDKELWGNRCGKCRNVLFPPKIVCPKCFEEPTEWVKLDDWGYIATFDVVNFPTVNPLTGIMREVPYTTLIVALPNGGGFFHFCLEHDPEKLAPGKKVVPVWKEKRECRPSDLEGWILAEDQ